MVHFLFFLNFNFLNLLKSKSIITNSPTKFFPIPRISFITSTDFHYNESEASNHMSVHNLHSGNNLMAALRASMLSLNFLP